MSDPQTGRSGTLPPAPYARLELEYLDSTRKRDRPIAVVCRECGIRLVIGVASDSNGALELAERNATRRSCCPIWTGGQILGPDIGALELELDH